MKRRYLYVYEKTIAGLKGYGEGPDSEIVFGRGMSGNISGRSNGKIIEEFPQKGIESPDVFEGCPFSPIPIPGGN